MGGSVRSQNHIFHPYYHRADPMVMVVVVDFGLVLWFTRDVPREMPMNLMYLSFQELAK